MQNVGILYNTQPNSDINKDKAIHSLLRRRRAMGKPAAQKSAAPYAAAEAQVCICPWACTPGVPNDEALGWPKGEGSYIEYRSNCKIMSELCCVCCTLYMPYIA